MPSTRLTRTSINALPAPASGNQALYMDREQPHFGVRVTVGGARSFIVDKNTSRGRIRITLGPAGTDDLTVAQAREQARIALGLIGEGFNRAQIEERLARAEDRIPEGAVTFGEMHKQYLLERRHKLAESTRADYEKILRANLSAWKNTALEAIDEREVVRVFTSIKSPSRANYAMRLARAVFRYARTVRDEEDRPLVARNPVDVISQRRLWHAVDARRSVIGLAALPVWWKAVAELQDERGNGYADVVRDYLRLVLLTGLRKNEAARLRWVDVDLRGGTFTVTDTKNREAHALPLSSYLFEMLERRRAAQPKAEFVFETDGAPLNDPKYQISKVRAASGVEFSLHDLRRTFATIAESLDIPYFALKRLLNHKTKGDVTAEHYTVITAERLREPMEKITDFILRAAGERETAPVVDAQRKAS